jgi:hypothetical protein
MTEPYTREEMREILVRQMWIMVRYWENDGRTPSVHEKLSGLMHSILVIFDGESAALPAFRIFADPHPDDRAYSESLGEKYWPPFPEDLRERADLIGINDDVMLHDRMYGDEAD